MRAAPALSTTSMAVAMLSLAGCPDSDTAAPGPICLDAGVEARCAPAYEPTYDAIYANTLRPSCAKSGVSCHASTGRQGGLSFEDAEEAYASLRRSQVRPGEPACSVLVQRVLAESGSVRMPPGRSLSPGEQCAIIRWIADGARR